MIDRMGDGLILIRDLCFY